MSALLTIDRLSAAAPDGTLLFTELTLSLGRETVGLVGRNGSGKSTLLAILAGEREPTAGIATRTARIAMLRQVQPHHGSVAEALGIAEDLARLRRLDAGQGSVEDAGLADWTLEQRLEDAFASVKLSGIVPDRSVGSLSGGERTRLGLAAMLLGEPEVLLMDEPTNNLDADGREAIGELLAGWPGGALVASHDRALLEGMDRIVQLSPVGVFSFGGGWSAFVEARDAERERARDELDRAARNLKQQSRAVQRQAEKKARRDKAGRAKAAKGDMPRILLGARAERAENTGARDQHLAERLLEDAGAAVEDARKQVEIVTPIRIELPSAGVPANRRLLRFDAVTLEHGGERLFGPLSFSITGPERVVVSGANGSGKSSLLRIATGDLEPSTGTVERAEGALAMLDQHVGILDPARDLVANMRARHPAMTAREAHEVLARFAFRNRDALRPAATLSGGEKLRAGLALVTGGPVPPQLLVLDEPTNHLDIEAVEMLEQALASYDGALLLVSHDRRFLEAVGCDREFALPLAIPAPAP
ncbi:ABC-F family ATP-binding cassette domain-containing protein [Pelagerythrobacter rhizovicinus]|uniref:ABC-F family ATP-binding cassette domain-containing protein n=1 Tax=Pelagerythrobacter rhizovicinus TaxID=2268576 RepID=A0A4Q2KI12_9SPHN|nr:ABC-F family ATP-binding cassette domain-containing protein [Pelagerythrobacter rhizovicinus]RXZ63949.1 ABC-F family ATP-binding cassette domain-containing protein [Pelagerythrobacter rhizovicinus]